MFRHCAVPKNIHTLPTEEIGIFLGGGMDIFWNYTFIKKTGTWRLYFEKNVRQLCEKSPDEHNRLRQDHETMVFEKPFASPY